MAKKRTSKRVNLEGIVQHEMGCLAMHQVAIVLLLDTLRSTLQLQVGKFKTVEEVQVRIQRIFRQYAAVAMQAKIGAYCM